MLIERNKRLIVPKKVSGNQLLFGYQENPVAPIEVSEEVARYAKENGRLGRIDWVPVWNVWLVRLSRRPTDPLLRLVQTGQMEEAESFEDIPLQEYDPEKGRMVSLDIHQLGASGVRQFLERGNTWSGRGQFNSLQEGLKHARELKKEGQERLERSTLEKAKDRAMDLRRWLLRIPYHTAGIDLKGK